jgi:hypothetical protein
MKVVVLCPSQDYQKNAGSRIRYGRMAQCLSKEGISLSLEEIAEFDPKSAECDVLIISKCHDARALVIADIVFRRGIRVGVDLFDDYFSQSDDSRLGRFRLWLRQLVDICDFAICSTAAIAELVGRYRRDLAVHIINDPAPEIDFDRLATTLFHKTADACSDGLIRLCWFGIGDNPHFPVGISDLSAFSAEIARLASHEFAVELSILTNPRALDASRLAMIADLPFPANVEEWSEQRESELLHESLLCFLPVNAQPFSVAKSLNRAFTALTAGCQVLSAGYPLYATLDPLIYRDSDTFAADLKAGNLRLSPLSLDLLRSQAGNIASAHREAGAFGEFLRKIVDETENRFGEAPVYLVHGYATSNAAHKMTQRAGGLSIASPFCTARLTFDVIFQARFGGHLAMLLSDKALTRLLPEERANAEPYGEVGGRAFWELAPPPPEEVVGEWTNTSISLQLALYPRIMQRIRNKLENSFGSGRLLISESSPLPFEAPLQIDR